MDNITHSLVGAVLAQTGLKRKTRKGTAALILGANAPDIDVFFGWVPWAPLATHRGFTHGFFASSLIMPVLVTGLLWLIDRWQVGRGKTFEQPLDWRWLLGLSLIGCATHPLLDWQTTYAVQLYSPFSTRWYHVDTLFIIDVWLWLLLGGAFFLSRRLEKRSGAGRKLAVATLATMMGYIGFNFGITYWVKQNFEYPEGRYNLRVVASPPPIFFYQRELVSSDGEYYYPVQIDPLKVRDNYPVDPIPSNMANPIVREAIVLSSEIQRFLRWSIMPVAEVALRGCVAQVTFNDARYMNAFSRASFERIVEVPLRTRGCP